MSDQTTTPQDQDRRWRKLAVIGSFTDVAARLIEIFLRR